MTTKSRYIRASCITAALVFIAFAALACGHGGASLTPKVAAQPAYLDMNEALAELDALPAPAGVDAALFAQLKSTFAALLRTQGKIASTPPRQAINDLDIIPGTAGAMPRATWSSDFFIGDGDQNGVVGISDITPVAMWFHQSVTNAPLSKVADYNRNGTVEISDITPLAMNFAHRATEFAIETGPTATGPFTERAAVLWDGQLPDKNVNGFAAFEYELALADFAGGAGTWVRAVPRDADSVEGEPSAALFALYPNIAPTASLAGNPTSGEAPLEVVFDATGSSDSDGTITSYDYDWDSDGTYDLLDGGTSPSHIYDVEGDYNAALRVTDNLGATATASLPVSVTPPSGNLPPVAVLTADPLSGDAPLLVDFDASGSYDPDNNVPPNNGIELYEWDWDSDGVYDLSGMSPTAQYTFNLPSAIGYTVTVRVTDSVGATATDNVIVQVNSASSPPAIVSVSPLAGEEGTAVILTATVTGTPPFDYSFDMTAPASWATPDYVSDSGSAVEASVTLGTPGIYMLTVNVSNAFGSDNRMEAFVINPAGSEWDIYPVDATNSPTYSSLAIIDATPGIAYFGSGSEDLLYAYCSTADGTGSWSSVTVDAKGMGMGDVGTYCSLTQTGDGPAISYYEGGIDCNLRLAYNSNPDGSGTWNIYNVDNTGDAGWITSIEGLNDAPAIGYFRDNSGTVDYCFAACDAKNGNGTWTYSTVATVDSGLFADGRVLRVLDGKPAVAFYNWIDSQLQFSINSEADGSGTWSSSLVDAPSIMLFPSMNVINSGMPAIAYRNFSSGTLDVGICDAADGTGTWTNYQVDTTSTPQFTSIADIGGYPAIAYLNIDADTLLYAICSTADGSGTWSNTTVDSGDSIAYVSLLEVDGRACIAYAKTATGVLNFARRNW